MAKRVLICGNPDLNYIDGSSIWAQTIALATAATGDAEIEFLARSAPARDELYGPLKACDNLTIIDGSDRRHWQGRSFARITPAMMGELALRLDRTQPYDVIIVRGLEIATQLLNAPHVMAKSWMYLTDIPQSLADYTPDQRFLMQRIAQGCRFLLCQTEGFKALWMALVPDLDKAKLCGYTPVIPDPPKAVVPVSQRPLQAVYAGKFKGDWMTLEMAHAWPVIHSELPESELLMIGDKVHDEPERPGYKQQMQKALETTHGLKWLGAQSRKTVQQLLQQARVGLSWRHESMNDTIEYSTKILEYGGAGCAAIVNRNPLHEQLLSKHYPLYANSAEEFRQQLIRALNKPQVAQQAADALRQLAERHTFSRRVDEIRQWLAEVPKTPKTPKRAIKTRVLVVGHDLKFFTLLQKRLEATGKFEFLSDQWQGHNKHNEARSFALLDQGDLILCEWCLGNLKWYSQRKKPHQRLFARFHAQEALLPYMRDANWDNIDLISFVSEHTRSKALEVFKGFPLAKTKVIPNFLDNKKFTPKQKSGAAQYTLGMIGIVPRSKRLDRALDLLEALTDVDNRYCLRIKSKHPLEYRWILSREEELKYYRNILARINSNRKLRHSVIFDPSGDDVNDWLAMVGFVLSPSDFESFHMAIGEGILTGAKPIIWDWDGAAAVWGSQWVVRDVGEAMQRVLSWPYEKEIDQKRQLLLLQSQSTVDVWQRLMSQDGQDQQS